MMEHQNLAGTYSIPYIARTSWAPIIIFFILGGLITLILLPTIVRDPTALPFLLLVWGPIIALLFWISSHKIVLLSDRIRYISLFSRKKMFFSDITSVEVRITRGRGAGYILQIYDNSSSKPLEISVKPFSRRDVSIVVDAIATHAPSVTLDGIARQLREGTFTG